MNIEIKRIANGWLLVVTVRQGASATYYAQKEELLAEVVKLMGDLEASDIGATK